MVLFDDVQQMTWFLSGSAKRKEIFWDVSSNDRDKELLDYLMVEHDDDDELSESLTEIESGSRRHYVPKFCVTCWSARVNILSALIGKYVTVLETVSRIKDSSVGDAKLRIYAF